MARDRSFGEALRRHRRAAGLSQEQLAEAARLSVRGISDLERGARTTPHRQTVALLAEALHLSPQDREQLARASAPDQSPETPRGREGPPVAALTSFIGRERELAEVHRLLAASRLVTLTGAGGCGKTRLALRLAEEPAPTYRDGVALVELADLADPALAPHALAAALAVREPRGRPLLPALAASLRDRRLLLLLDNCEHLLDACARLVEALLASCAELRILATSREPLLAAGEVVYRVPSLATPPVDRPLSPEELLRYDAARVFVDRARTARPEFAVTPRNAPTVAQVCAQLDGIPLALELAAGRLRAFPVELLAARLDDRFRLLTAGRRTALPRQQTLRAAIDWSYGLLTEPERTLFSRLAVFAGGFTLEAAEAVVPDGGLPSAAHPLIADTLARLVDKSMVVMEERPEGGVRYRLLETLRQYAGERLAERGEVEAVRRRHARHIVELAEGAERPGPRAPRRLVLLDAEQANVRAAWGWCREQGAGEWQARIVAGLGWYWLHMGGTGETRAWAEEALAQVAALGVHPLRAGALYGAGLVAYDQGDLDAGARWLEESRALWQALGDEHSATWATIYLSLLVRDRGDYAGARALAEPCLVRFRALGDAWAEAFTQSRLGMLALAAGDPDAASLAHERGLAGFRATGDAFSTATALGYLGAAARARGDIAEAARLHGEALAMDRELPWARGVAERLATLAGLAAAVGQLDQAARLLGATAAQLRAGGARRLLPSTRAAYETDLALVRARLGEDAFARRAAAGAALPRAAAIAEALALASELVKLREPARPDGLAAGGAEARPRDPGGAALGQAEAAEVGAGEETLFPFRGSIPPLK